MAGNVIIMIYKINFNIIKISQQSYVNLIKLIDDMKEGFVTVVTKDNLNTVTKMLESENVPFNIEEIEKHDKPK